MTRQVVTEDQVDSQKRCSEVDEVYLQQAEQQAFELLYHQRQQFNQRWQQNTIMQWVKNTARWIGIMVCVIGFMICLASVIGGYTWSGSQWPLLLCLGLFLLCGVLLYKAPDFEPVMLRWTDQVSYKSCRKMAQRCIKGAHQMAPFTARYELSAGNISYHRDQQEAGNAVWTRSFKGHALIGEQLTILVKKERSLYPQVVILLPPTDDWLNCLKTHNINHYRSGYG